MEVKKIVEGMTAVEVAEVIDSNFKNQNKILEEDIVKQNNVIGVSEYKDFSEAEAVSVGDVRKYNGFLYECVEATTGAFDARKWKKSSFKVETEKKLSELGSKVSNIGSLPSESLLVEVKKEDGFLNLQTGNVYNDTSLGFKVNTYKVPKGGAVRLSYTAANPQTRTYVLKDELGNVFIQGNPGDGLNHTELITVPSNVAELQICYSGFCEVYVTSKMYQVVSNIKCLNNPFPVAFNYGFININSNQIYNDTSLGFCVSTYKISEGDIFEAKFVSGNQSTRMYVIEDSQGNVLEKGGLGDEKEKKLSIIAPKNSEIIRVCYKYSNGIDAVIASANYVDSLLELTGFGNFFNIINPFEELTGFINIDNGSIVVLGDEWRNQFYLFGYKVEENNIYNINFIANNLSTRQYIIYGENNRILKVGEVGDDSSKSLTIEAPKGSRLLYISAKSESVKVYKVKNTNVLIGQINVPNRIFAVVGDTLQIFFDSIVESLENYWISVDCEVGKVYSRYFEFTPTLANIGNIPISFTLKNSKGENIVTKTSNIVVADVPTLTNDVHVLIIGDSTTETGVVPNELSRRIKGTKGYTEQPSPLELNRIKLLGRCHADAFGVPNPAGDDVGWEATGGWSWQSFATFTERYVIKLNVENAVNVNLGDSYVTNNNGILIISEKNVNESTGKGILRGYWAYGKQASVPTSPGVITLNEGTGQQSIEYSSATAESFSPFVSSDGTVSFIPYVETYMEGKLDVVIFTLGINGSGVVDSALKQNYQSVIDTAKVLIDTIHSEYPSCKIIINGLNLPSQNMGGTTKKIGIRGTNKNIYQLNKYYEDFANSEGYSSFVIYNDLCCQVDSVNAYPVEERKKNTRCEETEIVGTNLWHPKNEGYFQIADADFRALINIL